MFSDDVKVAFEHAAEAMRNAFAELAEMYKTIEELDCEAEEEIEARKKEREGWGHPPERLLVTYNQPVKKIRPCARSFGRR